MLGGTMAAIMRGPRPGLPSSAVTESSATSLRATGATEAHVAQVATAGRPKPESYGSKTKLGMLWSLSTALGKSTMRGARLSALSSAVIESSVVGRELEGDGGDRSPRRTGSHCRAAKARVVRVEDETRYALVPLNALEGVDHARGEAQRALVRGNRVVGRELEGDEGGRSLRRTGGHRRAAEAQVAQAAMAAGRGQPTGTTSGADA